MCFPDIVVKNCENIGNHTNLYLNDLAAYFLFKNFRSNVWNVQGKTARA